MTNLREMHERRQQWMNEKPQFDGGVSLRVQKDDLIWFNFVSNGDDGDAFIKVYRSHIIDTTRTNNGNTTPISVQRYCPIQSGESGVECAYCAQGHTDIKERMSIWMYVTDHLHVQLPQDKQFPIVNYEGRNYFREEVNDFKLWETSAWRESPWADIVKLAEIYKGLHNFTAQLVVVSEKLERRYKVYAIPQSTPLQPEIYERAKTEIKTIPQTLHEQLGSAVTVNPATATSSVPATLAQAWSPPGASAPSAFVPGSASPAAVATAPTSAIPSTVPGAEDPGTISAQPEEDTRRPLKKMF